MQEMKIAEEIKSEEAFDEMHDDNGEVIEKTLKERRAERRAEQPRWWRILKIVLVIVLIVGTAFGGLVAYLSATEYKPEDTQEVEITETGSAETEDAPVRGQTLRIVTWNIGYGALGDNADFFLDGGTGVKTADETRVEANLQGVTDAMDTLEPDFVFLQEVDRNSLRSYYINEEDVIERGVPEDTLTQATFAYNYNVRFIPYPVPPIGRVESGILTLSSYRISESERIQLPCPFSWPARLGNLKRCLMVDRLPVTDADGKDSGKELVLVNLHLEAYDSGEGKAAQTQMLREVLQTEADRGNYVIAGGDFNQTFSGTDDSMYPEYEGNWHCGEIDESDFDESWQFLMDNKVPTCRYLDQPYAGADRETFQYYMIDGFIVSGNVEVQSVSTQDLGFASSDHNPVAMDFVLK